MFLSVCLIAFFVSLLCTRDSCLFFVASAAAATATAARSTGSVLRKVPRSGPGHLPAYVGGHHLDAYQGRAAGGLGWVWLGWVGVGSVLRFGLGWACHRRFSIIPAHGCVRVNVYE